MSPSQGVVTLSKVSSIPTVGGSISAESLSSSLADMIFVDDTDRTVSDSSNDSIIVTATNDAIGRE